MNESSKILRLGYVRENFPYIANCSLFNETLRKCKNAGIMSEAWLQFADYYGYSIKVLTFSPIKLLALIDAVYLYFIGIGISVILLAGEIGIRTTAVFYCSKILETIEIHYWHFIKKYGTFSWKNESFN